MPLPPGPRTPGLANIARFARRPLDTLLAWRARYGNVFTVTFTGFGAGVYVGEPDAIQTLFTGDQSDLRAGEANAILEPVVGPHSVLVLDGKEHMRQRKLLLAPLTGARVNGYREVIREVAEREIAGWQPGGTLVLRERMRALTFEVICRVVFGVTEPARVKRLQRALGAVLDSSTIMLLPVVRNDFGRFSPGGKLAARLRAADALIFEEIALRRGVADLDERDDVLSLLLRARDEDDKAMTDAELRDELFTMLAAGHETTATSLTFALEFLARHPAALSRLRDDPDDDAYLDAVAKETLRLRPVIDAAERTLAAPREVAGHHLPAGVKVYPGIWLVHSREDLYERALEFRPERFLDEGAESYSWLPFGGGIRRCIGAGLAQAEIVEALRVIAPHVELRPLNAEPDPVVLRGITVAPQHGVKMQVVARRDQKIGGSSRLTPSASR